MGVIYNTSLTSSNNLVFFYEARAYSGTTWYDLSGKNNNGTIVNNPEFNSANNGYLYFDGTNKYVSISNALQIAGNELSFCIWNFGIEARVSNVIWLQGPSVSRALNVHLPFSDGTVYFDMGDTTGYDRISKAAGTEYLGWHHWVFTKNVITGIMNIYRDGALWQTGSARTRPIINPDAKRQLFWESSSTYHKANVTSCQLYTKELSLPEVQKLYRISRGRHGV